LVIQRNRPSATRAIDNSLGWIFPPPGETRSRGALLIFDSADDALAANERAGDWVRHNVLEFTKGMPEVMAGNVLVAEAK
jgi:hypothetical protein